MPKDGSERTIRRFLFLPKCLNDEYRWLECASILQQYYGYDVECGKGGYWADIEFVNSVR